MRFPISALNRLGAAFAGLLISGGVSAQNLILQQPVTPGHIPTIVTNNIMKDGGSAFPPFATAWPGVVSSNQQTDCIYNAPVSGPYSSLCLGVTTDGNGWITLQNVNGAVPSILNFVINGVTYGFPGTGGPYLPLIGGTLTGMLSLTGARSMPGQWPGVDGLGVNEQIVATGTPTGGFVGADGSNWFPLNLFSVTDNVNVTNGTSIVGTQFNDVVGGTAAAGHRVGVLTNFAISGPMGGGASVQFVGDYMLNTMWNNITGSTSGTPYGGFFGLGVVNHIAAGVDVYEQSGFELDMFVDSSTLSSPNALALYGQAIKLSYNTPAGWTTVNGSEAFIRFESFLTGGPGPAGTGITYGLYFGEPQCIGFGGCFPISSTGTMIYSLPGTAGSGIDFSSVTFNTAFLKGPGGFIVNGSGAETANSIVLGSPTGGNEGTGTINATGIFQNGTSIGSGPFLPLAGGTMAGPIVLNPAAPWSGTALTQTPINTGNVPIIWTGTTGSSGGTIALGLYFNFGTQIDAHLNSVGGVAGAVVNTEYYTGAQGGLTGIVDNVNIPSGQTIADTVPREFVSGRDFATAASATGVAHSLLGRTIVSQLLSGATGYGGNTGLEVAISSASGTAPGNVSNAYFMRYAADVARGTTDRMLGFWTQYAQTSGRGSPTTIDIGPQGQLGLYFPTPPDGTVMKASLGASDSSVTVASILDFSAITTVTNYDILMPNFSLSGGGSATLVSLYAGLAGGDFIGLSGGAAATADAVGITASGADTLISIVYVSKGGGFHKFFAGTSELFDVAAVASAISRIVVTPAASGNVLLDVAGTATGITIGGTTATGITLGKSAFAPNAPGGITLGTAGSAVGSATFLNATSGSVVLSPPTGALGTKTLTLPDVTDTFAVLATAQTFSATETFADAGTWGSAGISGTTINNSAIGGTTAAAAKFTTLAASSTVTFGSSTTGSTAQTYTNGPCTTSATTAQWIPIAITGQSGTWYVPACH